MRVVGSLFGMADAIVIRPLPRLVTFISSHHCDKDDRGGVDVCGGVPPQSRIGITIFIETVGRWISGECCGIFLNIGSGGLPSRDPTPPKEKAKRLVHRVLLYT